MENQSSVTGLDRRMEIVGLSQKWTDDLQFWCMDSAWSLVVAFVSVCYVIIGKSLHKVANGFGGKGGILMVSLSLSLPTL